MDKDRAYTRQDFVRAVNVSALLGWLAVAGPIMAIETFSWPSALAIVIVLPVVAVMGLPIAFTACWMVGAPILWRAMRYPMSWVAAACWGAFISSLMLVVVAIMANGGFVTLVWSVAVVVGLSTAFVACWLVGAPVLWWAMRRPISWVAAAFWGGLISFLMVAIWVTFGVLVDNGLPPHEWWELAQVMAILIAISASPGIVIALIVRAVIGAGNRDLADQGVKV